MKAVTIDNVRERIAELNCLKGDGVLSLRGEFELACLRQLVAQMQPAPVANFEEAVELFKTMNIGFPVERTKADYVIGWCLANLFQPGTVVTDANPSLNTMMRALDAFYADDDVPERAMLAAFKILLADVRNQAQTEPATDNTAQQFESLATNTEPCVICGVVSSHQEGWHYCNAQPATSAGSGKQ